MSNLRHAFNLSLFLFVIWLLLSGHYTPQLLVLGTLSTLFVVLVAIRVDLVDREIHPVLLKPSALLYWLWLAGQVIKANIDVTRRILDPRLPIVPRMASSSLETGSWMKRLISWRMRSITFSTFLGL